MDWTVLLYFALGLVLLTLGADWLIRGATGFASSMGISQIIIGLTVVALGTSLPEGVVSLTAAIHGSDGIALGNVLGSNVANFLLVLGLSAMASPLVLNYAEVRIDFWLMIGLTVFFAILSLDGHFGRIDGGIFLALLIANIYRQIRQERANARKTSNTDPRPKPKLSKLAFQSVLVLVGLAMIVVGADRMIDSSVTMAQSFGMSDIFIGLTVVAIGTSLPELAATFASSLKGADDIGLGNIVGSNFFNLAFVLGSVALIRPIPVERQVLYLELPAALVAPLMILPFVRSKRIGRLGGFLLLSVYIGYIAFLYTQRAF